jgi:hypothetical protein
LKRSIRKMQEDDNRPDSYDFYFSAGELHDGTEIGRYIRHDRAQMPGDLTARGNLRLVLWEPEVMARFRTAPPLEETVRDMTDAVDRMCTFIETGLAHSEEDSSAECSSPGHGSAAPDPSTGGESHVFQAHGAGRRDQARK